ncbi:MAG TPA: prohibitin family protein [Steroidobacteraceae bacterium]|nr:prohibitin family protein [Steroidobacteraceae bacterium]
MSSRALRYVTIPAAVTIATVGCTTIPSGRTGVEWTYSGGTLERPLGEGFHWVSPLSQIYLVDMREQQREEDLNVLANNGLDITISASVLYQPIPGQAPELVKQIGPDYYDAVIGPYVRSSARRVVGRYGPEEVYSTKREQIEREIRDQVSEKLAGMHVRVDAILIREVRLPAEVQQAIQTKLREEQRALEMKFVLDRSRQEAERKRIEAKGIADYQSIISAGLNPQIIEWQGIQATEQLAQSPNSKVIIIGSGKEGLPVILNAAPASPAAVATTTASAAAQ